VIATIESIYRQHRKGLFTLALSITGRAESAEDAVHEAVVRLFGGRTKRRPVILWRMCSRPCGTRQWIQSEGRGRRPSWPVF
jgi:DNA-directed RNA polymerase specialized sigma24 family protein